MRSLFYKTNNNTHIGNIGNKPHITTIDVYTDGSLIKYADGSLKGCGYGVYFPNDEIDNMSDPFIIGKITNNRAELYAIYRAIQEITKKYSFDIITIYTDSRYALESLTKHIILWKKNGWKNAKRKPVENQDLIMMLDEYMLKYQGKINIQWIRGHTKKKDIHSINNAKADNLANKGAELYSKLYGT